MLAFKQAEPLNQSKAAANQTVDLTDLNEAVKMTKKEEIDAFLSKIILGQKYPAPGKQHACIDSVPKEG